MSGIGIGVLLITPEKEMIPYSLKLGFQCTHNMAEYEALIQGLKFCKVSMSRGCMPLAIHYLLSVKLTLNGK